jgi:hypothetical protein
VDFRHELRKVRTRIMAKKISVPWVQKLNCITFNGIHRPKVEASFSICYCILLQKLQLSKVDTYISLFPNIVLAISYITVSHFLYKHTELTAIVLFLLLY